jgi:hypothetical protein
MAMPMTADQQQVFMQKLTDAQTQLQVAKDAAINTQNDAAFDAAITAVGVATTAMTAQVDA